MVVLVDHEDVSAVANEHASVVGRLETREAGRAGQSAVLNERRVLSEQVGVVFGVEPQVVPAMAEVDVGVCDALERDLPRFAVDCRHLVELGREATGVDADLGAANNVPEVARIVLALETDGGRRRGDRR